MTYKQADAILTNCTHTDRDDYRISSIRFHGRTIQACCDCWNAQVMARRAARKEQLDAEKAHRLRCCCCNKKPYSVQLAGYPLCGTCAKAAKTSHGRAMANAGAAAIFAGAQLLADKSGWYFTSFGSLRDWYNAQVAANPNTTL